MCASLSELLTLRWLRPSRQRLLTQMILRWGLWPVDHAIDAAEGSSSASRKRDILLKMEKKIANAIGPQRKTQPESSTELVDVHFPRCEESLDEEIAVLYSRCAHCVEHSTFALSSIRSCVTFGCGRGFTEQCCRREASANHMGGTTRLSGWRTSVSYHQ